MFLVSLCSLSAPISKPYWVKSINAQRSASYWPCFWWFYCMGQVFSLLTLQVTSLPGCDKCPGITMFKQWTAGYWCRVWLPGCGRGGTGSDLSRRGRWRDGVNSNIAGHYVSVQGLEQLIIIHTGQQRRCSICHPRNYCHTAVLFSTLICSPDRLVWSGTVWLTVRWRNNSGGVFTHQHPAPGHSKLTCTSYSTISDDTCFLCFGWPRKCLPVVDSLVTIQPATHTTLTYFPKWIQPT